MKKAIKIFTVLAMVVTVLAIAVIPASAAGLEFGRMSAATNHNDFHETQEEMLEDFESEIDWYQKEYESRVEEMHKEREELRKQREEIRENAQSGFDAMAVFVVIIIIVAVSLLIAEIAYIYIQAPKCGMSRLWALIPLFSNVLGLIVFIIVCSNRKTTATSAYTVTCPTCSGVHPAGTTQCSICGTRLQ